MNGDLLDEPGEISPPIKILPNCDKYVKRIEFLEGTLKAVSDHISWSRTYIQLSWRYNACDEIQTRLNSIKQAIDACL